MALKSTICKAELSVADMDRSYYADHSLTLARHPSETDERMMVRLLAFALYAHERMVFGNGLSSADEPDLWRKDYGGDIELWIDVGLPDPKWLRKACNQARQVVVINYGGRAAELWWGQNASDLMRFDNLTVMALSPTESRGLAELAGRGMRLQCNIQDKLAWMSSGELSFAIEPQVLKQAVGKAT
jgi:uncharacterized protein YaeQ